jgi:hypothetical protein
MSALSGPEAGRLLAEAHAARAAATLGEATRAAVSTRALWAHANRNAGAPVDFSVARALRDDPETAARYRTLLSGVAVAHAPFAIAASDGAMTERRVGAYRLSLVPATDGAPPLLVIASDGAPAPSAIEIASGDLRLRLALPEAVEGTQVLALTPEAPEAAGAWEALQDRAAEIFLI